MEPNNPATVDLVLLDRAIGAIQQVLARTDRQIEKYAFCNPAELSSLPTDEQAAALRMERAIYRAQPEQSAVHFCLTAANALLDISQTLVRYRAAGFSPFERERYLKSMVTRTKVAGRAAYRAALILTDQKAGTLEAESDESAQQVPAPLT